MLTHEKELLSQLRRKSLWDRFGNVLDPSPSKGVGGGRKGNLVGLGAKLFKSEESRRIYATIKAFFSREGGSSVLAKKDLLRVASATDEDPGKIKREVNLLEEPYEEEMGTEVIFQITTKFLVLSHHEDLLRSARNGGVGHEQLEGHSQELELLRSTGARSVEAHALPRQLSLHKPEKDAPGLRLPTYLNSSLDEALGGGLRRKEAGVLAAPSNHGKTANLVRLATFTAQTGLKVFYASCEIYLDQIQDRVKSLVKKVPPTFLAEYYDPESLTAEKVTAIADQVKPDLLIVDYLNLLKLDKLDPIAAIGSATRRLRSFAHRNNAVVWTAAQAHEPYEDQLYLRRDQVYGSHQIIHAADLVVGMLYIERRKVQTMNLWKTRHTHMGLRFQQQVDFVEMKFKEVNL